MSDIGPRPNRHKTLNSKKKKFGQHEKKKIFGKHEVYSKLIDFGVVIKVFFKLTTSYARLAKTKSLGCRTVFARPALLSQLGYEFRTVTSKQSVCGAVERIMTTYQCTNLNGDKFKMDSSKL